MQVWGSFENWRIGRISLACVGGGGLLRVPFIGLGRSSEWLVWAAKTGLGGCDKFGSKDADLLPMFNQCSSPAVCVLRQGKECSNNKFNILDPKNIDSIDN